MIFHLVFLQLLSSLTLATDSMVISGEADLSHGIIPGRNPPPDTLPCPDATDIFPCVCESFPDYIMDMDCSKVADELELEEAFQKPIPFKDFREMRIEGNHHIFSIYNGSFGDAYFQNIIIQSCSLDIVIYMALSKSRSSLISLNMADNRLRMQPLYEDMDMYVNLRDLDLSFNDITGDIGFQLASSSLRNLNIDGNPIDRFRFDVFNHLPNIEKISCENCNLTTIESDTFMGLTNLTYLALSKNDLSSLPENAIELFGDKSYLYLHNNSLRNVSAGAIKGVTEMITLQHNQLDELPEDVWKSVMEHVKFFYVYDNPLLCGCDIAWLILEPEFMKKLDGSETCFDGEKLVDLDPVMYAELCK